MVARDLITGEVIAQRPDLQATNQYARLGIISPDYGYEVIGVFQIPTGHPHFPYGKPVNPD